MPKVTAVIGEQEVGAAFEARIAAAANQLIENYCVVEHNSCMTLRHGRLNHIFELVGVSY
jgi:hypothetical protein